MFVDTVSIIFVLFPTPSMAAPMLSTVTHVHPHMELWALPSASRVLTHILTRVDKLASWPSATNSLKGILPDSCVDAPYMILNAREPRARSHFAQLDRVVTRLLHYTEYHAHADVPSRLDRHIFTFAECTCSLYE